MTQQQYLSMMEQLGQEPNPDEIPPDFSDFPIEVQEAIQIFSILPDIWEGMSGTYMGKDYSILPYLMDEIFEVEDRKQILQLLLIIGRLVAENHSRAQKQRMQNAKRKKSGKR